MSKHALTTEYRKYFEYCTNRGSVLLPINERAAIGAANDLALMMHAFKNGKLGIEYLTVGQIQATLNKVFITVKQIENWGRAREFFDQHARPIFRAFLEVIIQRIKEHR